MAQSPYSQTLLDSDSGLCQTHFSSNSRSHEPRCHIVTAAQAGAWSHWLRLRGLTIIRKCCDLDPSLINRTGCGRRPGDNWAVSAIDCFQNVVAKLGAIIRFQTNVPTSGWAHNNSSQPTCVNTCLCVCVKLLMFQTNSPGHQSTAHLTQSGLKWRYMD